MERIKDLQEAKDQKLPAPRFPQTSSIASEDGGGGGVAFWSGAKTSAKDMCALFSLMFAFLWFVEMMKDGIFRFI